MCAEATNLYAKYFYVSPNFELTIFEDNGTGTAVVTMT